MSERADHGRLVGADPVLAQLLADVHGECFEAGWSPDAFLALLAGPGVWARLSSGPDGPVALALCRRAADEAEILTLGVRPAWRRQGRAKLILRELLSDCYALGARTVFLEVAPSNHGACQLYVNSGFALLATRPDYYRREDGTREDALLLGRSLPVE